MARQFIENRGNVLCAFHVFLPPVNLFKSDIDVVFCMDTDLLVLGAGPSGMAASLEGSRLGLRVTLVDRKPLDDIGAKVCGDALDIYHSNYACRGGGCVLPDEGLKNITEHVVVELPSARIELPWKSYVVDRHTYGQEMLAHAIENGVKVFPETSISEVRTSTKGARVDLTSSLVDTPRSISAEIVIDATGAGMRLGKVMKNAPLWYRERGRLLRAFRLVLETNQPHSFQQQLFLGILQGTTVPGYVWAFSRGATEINVGAGCLPTAASSSRLDLKEQIHEFVGRRFGETTLLKAGGGIIAADLPPPRLDMLRIVKVGEAARLTSPVTGAGHGEALVSGFMAARASKFFLFDGDRRELCEGHGAKRDRESLESLTNSENVLNPLFEYSRWAWKQFGPQIVTGLGIVDYVERVGAHRFIKLVAQTEVDTELCLRVVCGQMTLRSAYSMVKGQYRDPRLFLGFTRVLLGVAGAIRWLRKYPCEPRKLGDWWSRYPRRMSNLSREYRAF